MKTLFYPGCSIMKSSRPYLDSLQAIAPALNLHLQEIKNWNCCGATEYLSASARTSKCSRILRLDGGKLRQLMDQDDALAHNLLVKINEALMERLDFTRTELAAARA